MKRILCLIDTLGFGGAERQMIGLAQLLNQRGYIVDLVSYYNHDFYSDLVEKSGLNVHVLKVGSSPFSKLKAVSKYIKKKGGYDWVIAYKTGPNIIGCILRLLGMKFHLIVSERNTTQHIRCKEKIQFQLYRLADYIVPNSHSQAAFIAKHFPWLNKKVHVINNFTDINHFTANFKKPENGLSILTTARVAKQKNIIRYLEAISLLQKRGYNNVHFDWYGDIQSGEEKYGEEVHDKLMELNLDGVVSFYPGTRNVLDKYHECDIFCLPSNYEGFPNVICEAMSCGKPIVCSRVCDNPYIVKEGENAVMFDNNNVEDIANKIQQVCQMSYQELSMWGKRSREIAEDILSMDAFVDKYIRLIEG